MQFRYVEKSKLKLVPQHSGVYALSQNKEILYIGKAANLRERIKNHFPASPKTASRGGHKSSYRDNLFIDKVTRVGFLETQSDIDALLLESQLIKEYQPRYNVMWRDDKGYFYVGITPSTSLRASKQQLPRVFLTHQPHPETQNVKRETEAKVSGFKFQVSRYVGPFVDGKAIKQVLRLLRRAFPYYTQKKHGRLPCPWCHLNLCPGPNPNPKEYRRNIKNLEAVLRGKKTSVWKNLTKEMGRAAKLQKYEEAAKLRDQIRAFKRVFMHSVVQFMLQQDYYDSYQSGEKQLRALLDLKKPTRRIEAYDISNIQGKFSTGSMVTFLQGKPAKEWYRKFKIHISGKPNDFAMMQELVSRRLRHKEWPYPDLMIIDGGKPQLSATLQAIKRASSILHGRRLVMTQIKNIQLAALAKRHNELFLAGRKTSILLKNLPQEVSNLLLHIRDEAHRFAITYHRKLRRIDAFSEK